MHDLLHRHARTVLYVALVMFFVLNLVQFASGQFLAALPATVQTVVFISVYTRTPWAHIVIRLWAALLVLSGGLMWLAVLLGGASFFHSAFHASLLTLALVLGVYFFIVARSVALSQRAAT
jgi:hypothetical protein